MIKIFLSILFLTFIQAPQPPKTHSLSDAQKAELGQLNQADQQQRQALKRTVDNATLIEVGPQTSIQFHAAVREAQISIAALAAQKDAFLAKARLAVNCSECTLEGDKLIPPKK